MYYKLNPLTGKFDLVGDVNQLDWNESDPESPYFIKNKPLITNETTVSGLEDREFGFGDVIAGTNKAYDIDLNASWNYRIESFVLRTDAGTLTNVNFYKNGVLIPGMTGKTASATKTKFTLSSFVSIAENDTIEIKTGATFTGTPTYLGGKINIRRETPAVITYVEIFNENSMNNSIVI